jgi:hypothetical protein
MEIGGEVMGWVERADLAEPVRLRLQDARAELELPQNLQDPPLVIVVEADQAHLGGLVDQRHRVDALDQILAMSDLDDVTGFRQLGQGRARRAGKQRPHETSRIEGAAHDPGREVGARSPAVVEVVGAAHLLELVPGQQPGKRGTRSRADAVRSRSTCCSLVPDAGTVTPSSRASSPRRSFDRTARTDDGVGAPDGRSHNTSGRRQSAAEGLEDAIREL